MTKVDFILLKMIFNTDLYEAVMDLSVSRVNACLEACYAEELTEGWVDTHRLSEADLALIRNTHLKEAETDTLEWAY